MDNQLFTGFLKQGNRRLRSFRTKELLFVKGCNSNTVRLFSVVSEGNQGSIFNNDMIVLYAMTVIFIQLKYKLTNTKNIALIVM